MRRRINSFDLLMVIAVILFVIFLLTGCSKETRTSEIRHKDTKETTSVSGSVSIPVASDSGMHLVAVPFSVTVDRLIGEEEHRDGNRETKLNVPELGAALATALNQVAPGLGSFLAPKPGGGLGALDWTMIGTAGVGLAGMLKKHRDAGIAQLKAEEERRLRDLANQRAEEHKADAAEGWAKAAEKGNA